MGVGCRLGQIVIVASREIGLIDLEGADEAREARCPCGGTGRGRCIHTLALGAYSFREDLLGRAAPPFSDKT